MEWYAATIKPKDKRTHIKQPIEHWTSRRKESVSRSLSNKIYYYFCWFKQALPDRFTYIIAHTCPSTKRCPLWSVCWTMEIVHRSPMHACFAHSTHPIASHLMKFNWKIARGIALSAFHHSTIRANEYSEKDGPQNAHSAVEMLQKWAARECALTMTPCLMAYPRCDAYRGG